MGCIFSAARPSLTVAGSVWSKVRVVPYGVLGTQLATDSPRSERRVGVAPDGETLVVDPCSARIVRRGRPSEAGGAAGAIYAFLGIDGDATFPADVVAAIAREGDVAYHRYGYPVSRHVVHAVGVDFRDRPCVRRKRRGWLVLLLWLCVGRPGEFGPLSQVVLARRGGRRARARVRGDPAARRADRETHHPARAAVGGDLRGHARRRDARPHGGGALRGGVGRRGGAPRRRSRGPRRRRRARIARLRRAAARGRALRLRRARGRGLFGRRRRRRQKTPRRPRPPTLRAPELGPEATICNLPCARGLCSTTTSVASTQSNTVLSVVVVDPCETNPPSSTAPHPHTIIEKCSNMCARYLCRRRHSMKRHYLP
mmetsp:Transcript_17298/g.69560  ORF Transcript_17298/g.69560 Transcript_17298/m.69560 type:complete len:370 (+) Transcript_17298:71-1180(+)